MSFDVLPNLAKSALRQSHAVGDGVLRLYSVDGFLVGCRVKVVNGYPGPSEKLLGIFPVTAINPSTKTLTIGAAIEGTVDIAMPVGVRVYQDELTSGQYKDVTDAIGTLQNGGNQGPQGETGPQGSQGATGAQGRDGYQGPQGSQGYQGYQGAAGANGVGTQGPQGYQGSPGTNGVGTQGPPGPQGNPGTTGVGTQGPQGYQGNQGASITGPQGAQGSPGVNGTQGFQGSPGPQGSQGVSGSGGGSLSIGSPVTGGNPNTILTLDNSGNLANGIPYVTTTGALSTSALTATAVPLTVKGAASQTANLQEWKGYDGTVLSFMNSQGAIFAGGGFSESSSSSGVVFGVANGTPRVGFFNGNNSQNWQFDNYLGIFRFLLPGISVFELSADKVSSNTTFSAPAICTNTLKNSNSVELMYFGDGLRVRAASYDPDSSGNVPHIQRWLNRYYGDNAWVSTDAVANFPSYNILYGGGKITVSDSNGANKQTAISLSSVGAQPLLSFNNATPVAQSKGWSIPTYTTTKTLSTGFSQADFNNFVLTFIDTMKTRGDIGS